MSVKKGQKYQYKNKSPFRAGGPIVEVISVDGEEALVRCVESHADHPGHEFTERVENFAQFYRRLKG